MFAFKTWSRLASVMAILSIALASTSCELFDKDDDKDEDSVKAKIVGTWQLKSLTCDPAIDWFGTTVTNVFAQLPACIKDDLVIIQNNNTYLEDEGASKCQNSDPQTVSGTWALNPAQTILSVTPDPFMGGFTADTIRPSQVKNGAIPLEPISDEFQSFIHRTRYIPGHRRYLRPVLSPMSPV